MSLIIDKEERGLTVTLKLTGILDISTTNLIKPYLENIEGIKELIIDFENIEFIDSTGIGSILDAIHLAREKNFKIEFSHTNEPTQEVFEMVGLYQILGTIQEGNTHV